MMFGFFGDVYIRNAYFRQRHIFAALFPSFYGCKKKQSVLRVLKIDCKGSMRGKWGACLGQVGAICAGIWQGEGGGCWGEVLGGTDIW